MKKFLFISLFSASLIACGDGSTDSINSDSPGSGTDSVMNGPSSNNSLQQDTTTPDSTTSGSNPASNSGMSGANGRPGTNGGAATGGTTGGSIPDSTGSSTTRP